MGCTIGRMVFFAVDLGGGVYDTMNLFGGRIQLLASLDSALDSRVVLYFLFRTCCYTVTHWTLLYR